MTLEQEQIPATAAGSAGHDSLVADALNEGELDARLGELAEGDEDLTAEQLREALGDAADGLDDAELMAEWKKAQASEAGAEGGTEEKPEGQEAKPEPIKLEGFKLYDAKGVEITDPTKVSALDLLTGKVQVGYNALSKEQRKNLRDLTRVASLGHYNEKVLVDTRAERAQAMSRAIAAEAKVREAQQLQGIWDQALTALVNGNPEPIQRLALAYQQRLATGGSAAAPAQNNDQEAQWDAAGQQFFNEHVVPRAQELATQYGANAIEVAQYIMYLYEQEGDFLTEAKIQSILQYEMPAILESHGFNAGAAPTQSGNGNDPRDKTIADLTKRLTALEAGKTNESTERLRGKRKAAPPSGGGSTPSGGETVPEMKTREDMKRFLRGE